MTSQGLARRTTSLKLPVLCAPRPRQGSIAQRECVPHILGSRWRASKSLYGHYGRSTVRYATRGEVFVVARVVPLSGVGSTFVDGDSDAPLREALLMARSLILLVSAHAQRLLEHRAALQEAGHWLTVPAPTLDRALTLLSTVRPALVIYDAADADGLAQPLHQAIHGYFPHAKTHLLLLGNLAPDQHPGMSGDPCPPCRPAPIAARSTRRRQAPSLFHCSRMSSRRRRTRNTRRSTMVSSACIRRRQSSAMAAGSTELPERTTVHHTYISSSRSSPASAIR